MPLHLLVLSEHKLGNLFVLKEIQVCSRAALQSRGGLSSTALWLHSSSVLFQFLLSWWWLQQCASSSICNLKSQ